MKKILLAAISVAVLSTPALFGASYVVPPDDVLVGKAQGIVIARATANWVEETTEHGIETVTEFAVEETLKGNVPHAFRIRMPGGAFANRYEIVPGAPRFTVGEQVLLFVNRRLDFVDYTTTDFGLGRFTLKDDGHGRRLALRDESEMFGWDLYTNQPHQERHRLADKFIDYVRAIASGEAADPDYFAPVTPLVVQPNAGRTLHPVTQACVFPACTATQYTLSFYTAGNPPCNTGVMAADAACAENGPGGRWTTFPSAVNWNRGNSEANVGNSGSDAVNAAFSAWDGDGGSNVNYVLATTTANANGINDAADGVNNIVFEKNNIGSAYTCSGGGLLGLGGIKQASGSNTLNGEMFFTNIEGDVSMNTGVGVCIGAVPGITLADFESSVTHEFGHTLGFRHSDMSRKNDQACTNFATYDCSASAIMTAILTHGLNATLQTWDQHAVQTLYPSPGPSAVTSVEAHATTTTNVQVSWSGSCSTVCHVYRSTDHTNFSLVPGAPAASPFNDATAAANTAYLYKVRAFNGTMESTDSNVDLATTVIFSDDPLVVQSTVVKALHTSELRTAINAVRTLAVLGAGAYTFPANAGDVVHTNDVTEMRANLDAAMMILTLTTGGYTDTSLSGVPIKAAHFQEIRNRVK